jgi:outer membrane protein assembly factor BamB
VLRDRTTTSCVIVGPLVACLTFSFAPLDARGSSPSNGEQVFPSDIRWTVEISARPVGAPVAAGDWLFVPLQSGVSARRVSDGGEVWNAKVEIAGALAASTDRVIVPAKGEIVALVAATGEVVWRERSDPLTAPPLLHGESLFTAVGEQLTSYNVVDGTKRWTQELGVIDQRPVVAGTRIYVSVSDGRLVALMLESGDAIWELDVGIKPTEPLVVGDRVYVGSAAKRFCSIHAQNGKEDWCFPVGAAVVGSAVADSSRVYFVALDNLLRAHDLRNGALRWKKDLRYRPEAGPSLVGNSIAAPGRSSHLRSFNTATGDPGDQLTLANDIVAPPVFIVSPDGGPTRLAAVFGGLQNLWKLALAGPPPPPPPKLPVGPVTVLPGLVVPLGARQTPPG